MRVRSGLLAFAALLPVLFLAPGPAAHAQNWPARVIALGRDITEIIYRLGEQSRLA